MINKNMNWNNLTNKWKGFGWNIVKGNGHDINFIIKALNKKHSYKPTVFLAKTIKGKGIRFMEKNNDWHHNRLTKNLYEKALKMI